MRVSLEGFVASFFFDVSGYFVFLNGRGRNLPDGVAGAQTNPLRDGAVLTLSFGKLLLGAESLVALYDGKNEGLVVGSTILDEDTGESVER